MKWIKKIINHFRFKSGMKELTSAIFETDEAILEDDDFKAFSMPRCGKIPSCGRDYDEYSDIKFKKIEKIPPIDEIEWETLEDYQKRILNQAYLKNHTFGDDLNKIKYGKKKKNLTEYEKSANQFRRKLLSLEGDENPIEGHKVIKKILKNQKDKMKKKGKKNAKN